MKFAATVFAALALVASAGAANSDMNDDGGGGGYDQLPTCNEYWYNQGTVLYVQGRFWRCVRYPYHWIIVG